MSSQLSMDLKPQGEWKKVKRDPKCSKCGLCEGAETVCLLGKGYTRARVMVIGEAPGQREDEEGEPFVGRSGKLLDTFLEIAGIDDADLYVTNAVHCRPPDNRTPSKREIAACRPWLMAEIAMVQPRFILLLGNVPLESLTGEKGIKKVRGFPIEKKGSELGVKHDVVYIMPTFHPSYALHDPRAAPVIQRDIDQFAQIIKQGGLGLEKGLNYKIVTKDNLEEALEDIDDEDVLSIDTENSGLDVFEPGFWCTSLGVGTSTTQWCFPLNHSKGPLYRKPNAQRRLVKRVIRTIKTSRIKKTIVMHNGKYDTKVIKRVFDEWIECDHDTMLASYNLDENSFHGLDHLASKYFKAMDYDIPMEEKHGFGDLNKHCRYLGLDVFYTRKLYYKQRAELERDKLTQRIFEEVTMPVASMYTYAELDGVPLDIPALEKAREYWAEVAKQKLIELNKLVPDKRTWKNKKTKTIQTGINWASAPQVAEVLFKRLKLKPINKTGKGADSVAETVLLRLADKHPVPKLILEYREATKNLGTFIEGWMRAMHGGCLHPNFKVHGTVTGRPSCEEPNLQQVPRDKRLRSLINAMKGWTLVDADLSQAELRIAAELSGDGELRLSYQTGVDVHVLTVQRIFGIMKPTSEERKRAKAVNFGFLYGMGWKKFIDYARDKYGVVFSEAEAKRIRKAFFRLYRGLPEWHKRQRRFAANAGYVRSLIGRKRRLPDAKLVPANDNDKYTIMRQQEAFRQAINSPVQSLASDFNLMAAVQLHRKLPREYFRVIGTVHDSILMLVRNDMLEEVLPQIKAAMEWPDLLTKWGIKLSVPIVAEIEIGPWGSGVVWEPKKKTTDGKRAA